MPQNDIGDILSLAFAAVLAMWSAAYALKFPGLSVPKWLIVFLMVFLMLTGGFIFGKLSSRGVIGGFYFGIFVALLNMLVLGGLLSEEGASKAPSFLIFIPGFLIFGGTFCAIGVFLARLFGAPNQREVNWRGVFASVTAISTLILLIVGGIVTGYQAGLAVVDWPNTFGYNMFLYPLSKMSGGIFFEHSHRLFGALVGLNILTLTVYLQLQERRSLIKWLSFCALLLVILQGVLGGLRVTGTFTLSTNPELVHPNATLAVIHGVLGQLLFVFIVALSVLIFTLQGEGRSAYRASILIGNRLPLVLLSLLIIQLSVGAMLRHFGVGLFFHIALAVIVIIFAIYLGIRTWALNPKASAKSWMALLLTVLVIFQIVLGFSSWIVSGIRSSEHAPTNLEVLITSSHQLVGALLLMSVVIIFLLPNEPVSALNSSQQADAGKASYKVVS